MSNKKFLTLLLLWACSLAAEQAPEAQKLTAIRLTELPTASWTDRQFIQADQEGRVFLLRESTREVYQVSSSGYLVPQGRLGKEENAEEWQPITEAAMSSPGDVWVLFSFPNHLDIMRGERQERIEAPWMVSAVVVGGGDLVVGVLPAEMASAAPASLRLESPPLLQSWDGKRWNTLAEGTFPGKRPAGVSRPEYLRGEFGVILSVTPQRQVWMADEHAYRLRRFSLAGVLKDELLAGERRIAWKERTAEEWKTAEAAATKAGLPFSRDSLSAVQAGEVIRAMTAGRDGAVYLLVQTDKGLALDRFQPALLTLERVPLAGIETGSGRLTMAAGKEGLYVAARSGRGGLWLIAAEALEKAGWQHVPDAMLNGQPLSPRVP